MSLTPRQAQRRYVGLTALRWLPIGISAPITVLLANFLDEQHGFDRHWRAAASMNDWGLRLSPGALRELAEELNAVIARYRDTREDPDQPFVSVLLDLFPVKEYPL